MKLYKEGAFPRNIRSLTFEKGDVKVKRLRMSMRMMIKNERPNTPMQKMRFSDVVDAKA